MASQDVSLRPDNQAAPAPTTDNHTMLLVAMILASGIVFLDSTVVNVALSAVDREFKSGLASLQWLVDGYALTLAAFLIIGGSLGDQYGRKRVMLFGLIAFGVVSLGCGIAPSVGWLTAARLAQGVAGAFLVPGSLAIITAVYRDPQARGKAIGQWSAWSGITSLLGPFLGGYLVDNLSWRWVFLINLPIVAVTVWLLIRFVPETSMPQANHHLDLPGAFLAVVGLGGPVYALIEGPSGGWGQPLVLIALIGGLVALVGFFWVEAHSPNPMMPLGLFRVRNFSGANLATFGVYFALYGASFFITIYIQSIMGQKAIIAGLVFLPFSFVMFLLSPYVGRWAGKFGPRLFMTFGPLIYAVGILGLTLLQPTSEIWSIFIPATLIMGLGLVLTVAPLTNAVMTSVSSDSSGTASAVNNVVSRIAGLLAVAGLGVVVSSVFTNALNDNLQGVPSPLATTARQAAADPTAVRSNFPNAPDVIRVIADSYTTAFHWIIIVCAVLAALGGLISFLIIRNPVKPDQPAKPPVDALSELTNRKG